MASSIFNSYVPPGVYTETKIDANIAGPPQGLQIPVVIGPAEETLPRTDFEMARGSSVQVDQIVNQEDVSTRFVLAQTGETSFVLGALDGNSTRFQVSKFPIVRGDGNGVTTNRVQDVTVTVNGVPVALSGLRGDIGLVTLQIPPQPGDVVRITYFYKRRDTLITDNLSSQVSPNQAQLLGGLGAPFTIEAGVSDILSVVVNGVLYQGTLPAGTGLTAASVATQINGLLIPGLTASVDTDNRGQDLIVLSSDQSLLITDGTANSVLGFFNGQRTSRNTVFFTFQGPIVDGRNGGVTTTNPADVSVLVDGVPVTASAVDGSRRAVTLPFAPSPGSTVEVTYYFNSWQNTFDDLPDLGVTEITRVGNVPGRADYVQEVDYILDPAGDKIVWGAAATIESVDSTIPTGTDPLDTTQMTTLLVDDRIYLEPATRLVDTSLTPPRVSSNIVVLNNIPTLGNGRDTPLTTQLFNDLANGRIDVPSNRPDLLAVYHGSTLQEALALGPQVVTYVDGPNRRVTLRDVIPPDHAVWATYYYNRLRDDTLTVTVDSQTAGLIPGQYHITSSLTGQDLKGVRFGTTSASDIIQWPSGSELKPDAFVVGTRGVNETVTVTFTQTEATPATYTSDGAELYDIYAGSSDQMAVTVDGVVTTTDLNNPAPGVLVSDTLPAGGSYTFTTLNNTFNYELDGTSYVTTFPVGSLSGTQVADYIFRSATPTSTAESTIAGPYNILSSVTGTASAPFDIFANVLGAVPGPFDIFAQVTGSIAGPYDIIASTTGANVEPFDIIAELTGTGIGPFNITAGVDDLFEISINGGAAIQVTLPAGAAVPLLGVGSVVEAIETAVLGAGQGLSVGPLNVPGNDVVFEDDGLGALRIRSTVDLTISANPPSTANTPLGFPLGGATDTAPNLLNLDINGQPIAAVLPGGLGLTAATIASGIASEISSQTTLTVGPLTVSTNDVFVGTSAGAILIEATEQIDVLAGTADVVLGLAIASTLAPRVLNLTINGTPAPILLSGGRSRTSASVVGEIDVQLAAALTNVGPISVLTNVADAIVATGNFIRLEAKEEIDIAAGSANAVLGFIVATTTADNTLDLTVNGLPVNITLTGTAAGRLVPSANIAAFIDAEVLAQTGLPVGVLTTLTNKFDATVNTIGQLDLQATEDIAVLNTGTANATLGYPLAGTSDVAANTFILTPNGGAPFTTTFTGGRSIPASTLISEIYAEAILNGYAAGDLSIPGNVLDVVLDSSNRLVVRAIDSILIGNGTANSILGFTNGSTDTTEDALSFTVNGSPVPITLTHGAGFAASAIVTQIQNALISVLGAGFVGPITTPPFTANSYVTTAGGVGLAALTSLTVNVANANATFGFVAGALPANPIWTRYRAGITSDRLLLRSRVLPTGPASVSTVRILSGNANATLGFEAFQIATGTERAVNKPATLLSRAITPLNLATLAASNPTFTMRANGLDFTVTGWTTVTTLNDVVTILGTALAGQATVSAEGDSLRITSTLDTPDSTLAILSNTANVYLGFSGSERANQRKVAASEIAAVLNWTALNWLSPIAGEYIQAAYAKPFVVTGSGTYLLFETFETGSTRSILFPSATASAINDTGLFIDVGDFAQGTDPVDGFDVTSNVANGSSGSGVVGQTYTDAVTGLRFTVLASLDAGYTPGESFTLIVSDTILTGNLPTLAIPGMELTVTTTAGVAIGAQAIVRSYKGSGNEPNVGDFYYVTYQYLKPSFDTQLFTNLRDVVSAYGPLSIDNPLVLAASFMFQNGAAIVGLKQVPKIPGQNQASAQAYIDAIRELERPIPNSGGLKPDVIIPLTGDQTVANTLVRSCEVQSSIRYRQERRCFLGVSSGTRPSDVATFAQGLRSSRAVMVYPDSAVVTLTNELGIQESFIVDSTYLAAALAAVAVSPQYDVAEPLTRKPLAGFSRLLRFLDEVEKNNLAIAGVTVLEDANQVIRVRHARTTNTDNTLTLEPTVIAIADFVQRRSRATLDRFIGTKFLISRQQDVETTLTALLNSLVEGNIIKDFRNVSAEPDPNEPTALRVSAEYAPILPLNYIVITFTLRANF